MIRHYNLVSYVSYVLSGDKWGQYSKDNQIITLIMKTNGIKKKKNEKDSDMKDKKKERKKNIYIFNLTFNSYMRSNFKQSSVSQF